MRALDGGPRVVLQPVPGATAKGADALEDLLPVKGDSVTAVMVQAPCSGVTAAVLPQVSLPATLVITAMLAFGDTSHTPDRSFTLLMHAVHTLCGCLSNRLFSCCHKPTFQHSHSWFGYCCVGHSADMG